MQETTDAARNPLQRVGSVHIIESSIYEEILELPGSPKVVTFIVMLING